LITGDNMAQYVFIINGKEYKVNVKSIEGNLAVVELNGKSITVNIKELGKKEEMRSTRTSKVKSVQTEDKPPAVKRSNQIKAPLPGVILKILVREGDIVKSGQDIIVMEAMKMENQIQANVSGTIKKIYVREGDTIQQEVPLIEIES